jgi:hypothetical protein
MVFTRQAQVPGRTDFRPVAATAALPPLKSVRLLDQVRERIRLLHYSLRTEEAYVCWARAFIRSKGASAALFNAPARPVAAPWRCGARSRGPGRRW